MKNSAAEKEERTKIGKNMNREPVLLPLIPEECSEMEHVNRIMHAIMARGGLVHFVLPSLS